LITKINIPIFALAFGENTILNANPESKEKFFEMMKARK